MYAVYPTKLIRSSHSANEAKPQLHKLAAVKLQYITLHNSFFIVA